MSARMFAACILILVLSTILIAGNRWEEIPYTNWSGADVIAVLNNSPWSVLCPARARRQEVRTNGYGVGGNMALWVRAMYRVQLLTAKPVREALLRSLSLKGLAVDAKDIAAGIIAERQQEILQKLVTSDPNNFMIKGDDKYLIIVLTVLESVPTGSQPSTPAPRGTLWKEDPADEELSNANVSELLAKTSLTTNSGKHVALAGYVRPDSDRLGAKFLFPRHLPDGSPFITAGDTELRFETRMNKTKIRVKFDLRKMLYKGKLET